MPETIDERLKRRRDRLSQRKSRNGRRSYVTEIENLCIILAWEAGEITEGRAARALGVGRIEARGMRLDALALGGKIAEAA